MSDQPQPILDYASPRKRGNVRLPAKSVLTVTHGPDGSVRVVERLEGQVSAAVFASAFGLFVACVAVAGVVHETRWILRHRHGLLEVMLVGILTFSALAELVLAGLVVRNTWRRTTLTADTARVTLEFIAPFMRRWYRTWELAEVQGVVLLLTQGGADAVRLAELQVRVPGSIVHLFTDHRANELETIERKLKRAMTGAPPEVEPLKAQPVLQLEVPPPDPQTFLRLRERREGLRDRLH